MKEYNRFEDGCTPFLFFLFLRRALPLKNSIKTLPQLHLYSTFTRYILEKSGPSQLPDTEPAPQEV
ncbi:hypothetical protein D5272_18355 [bacterium D16-76]|nr:hypothetical protein [bacterium D16-76]